MPERSHPDTVTGTEPNRVQYDVITARTSGDSHLEFLPEEPGETAVKQRVFVIEPIPELPPRQQAQPPPQVERPRRTHGVPATTRFLRLLHPRTVLLALYCAVAETLLALNRVVGWTVLLLGRVLGGAFLALGRVVGGAFLVLRRGVEWTFLALRPGATRAYVRVRSTTSDVARWTWNSCVGLIGRTTSIGMSGISRFKHVGGNVTARGRAIWRLCGVGAVLVRARLARDIRTLGGVMSMVGRHVSHMSRSLHDRCLGSLRLLGRNARRVADAHPLRVRVRVRLPSRQPLRMRLPSGQSLGMRLPSRQSLGMRIPSWTLKTPGVRVPGMNLTLVAFTGGTALGALVMWLFGVQAIVPGLTDRTAARTATRTVAAPPAAAVTLEPFADSYVATAGIMPFTQQERVAAAPAVPVSKPTTTVVSRATVVPTPAPSKLPAMTVTSTPAGARVTVDGIGWGETPVTIQHLSPGRKVVRLTKEGYVSRQQIISVPDDRGSATVLVTLQSRD